MVRGGAPDTAERALLRSHNLREHSEPQVVHMTRPRNIDIPSGQSPYDEDPDARRAGRSLRHQLRGVRCLSFVHPRRMDKGPADSRMPRLPTAPEDLRLLQEMVPAPGKGARPLLPRMPGLSLQPPQGLGRPLPRPVPDEPHR